MTEETKLDYLFRLLAHAQNVSIGKNVIGEHLDEKEILKEIALILQIPKIVKGEVWVK